MNELETIWIVDDDKSIRWVAFIEFIEVAFYSES